MRGRTQRAGEPRPGRRVFALRSVVWPLEGAALPPTRRGRRGKEAAGALLGCWGRSHRGPPAGVVMTLSLAGRPRELEAGPPPCASFALCSQGPGRSRPEPQTLGSGRSLGPRRGRAGSRRVFISRPRMPEPAGGPGDLRLVAETEPPGATSPGRFPGGGGGAPSPRPLRDLGHFQGWRGVTQPGSPWLCCPGTAVGPVVWPPGASARFCHRGVSVGQAPRTRAPVCGHLSLGPRPGLGLSPKRPRSRRLSVCLTL